MSTSTIWGPTVVAIDQDLRDALERTMLDIQYFMESEGKVYLGIYEAGVEVTSLNEFIRKDYNFYVPNSDAVLPFTLTGDWSLDRLNFTIDSSSGGTPADFGLYIRTVESFGVVGDGITDDTVAFSEVCAYKGKVIGHAGLNIKTNGFTWTAAVQLDMQGGIVTFASDNQRFIFGALGISVVNTTFDGNNLSANTAMFRIPAGFSYFTFDNCVFRKLQGKAGVTDQYMFYIDADDMVGRITNCRFSNISAMSTPAPTSAFCGSMLIGAAAVGPRHFIVDNCLIQEIASTNIAGDINNSDADGIRFYGASTVAWNTHLSNITIINAQKSGIKTSGTKGITCKNIKIVGNRTDLPMIAGMRIQAADDSTFSNLDFSGWMTNVLNIRSKNVTITGVVYNPIDTARDYPTLLQFQSGDASITEHVSIDNVVARNISQVVDCDPVGVTVDTAFRFMTIANMSVTGRNVFAAGVASRLIKAAHIKFENVRFFDPTVSWTNCATINSCQNLIFSGCRFEARRSMFVWTQGVGGISGVDFFDCVFYRPDSAQAEGFAILDLRDDATSFLDRITLNGCRMSVPSVAASGQQFAVRIALTNSVIHGLDIRVRTGQANGLPGYVYGVALASKFTDIHISSDSVLAYPAGVGYGVALLSTSGANMISDVSNNTGRGVQLQAGANNNIVGNAAGKLNALANAGTGNIVGNSLIYP